jgi:uncharacterized protein (DUF169 family)
MTGKRSYAHAAAALSGALSLRQPPLAISFAETVPPDVQTYAGRVPAGCKFWEEGATVAFATSASDHNLCAIGVHTHNLAPSPAQQTDLMDALKVFGDLEYVRAEDVASIPVLRSRPNYVVYAPLTDSPLSPEVVLLFVNANQSLILSEATQQVENQNPPAMGRPACAIIPQVMNTGVAGLSLGCCGARAYLDRLADDVAVFAIPGAKLEVYARRIEALAKANAVLSKFHHLRRHDVEAGNTPSIKESLAALAP